MPARPDLRERTESSDSFAHMLSVLSRGERMVRSEVVTLDPTGVAELSERGISGVQSGDLASVLVVEDR